MKNSYLLLVFIVSISSLFAQQITKENIDKELSFTFNGHEYDAILIDSPHEKIKMHWLDKENYPYKNIKAVKNDLEKKGNKILMITNGGMYLKDNIPQGLFIEAGKTVRPIDTLSNKYGNFYMKPNGVFYTSGSGAFIVKTETFIEMYSKNNQSINYATQSGPMLLIDGKINPLFNPESTNYNLRSGVGIQANGNVVFVISRSTHTTFYDFATIFKEKFSCTNALYLDGAISKMYLKGLRPYDFGGDFGVIISVVSE